jgi:hypothetical protein
MWEGYQAAEKEKAIMEVVNWLTHLIIYKAGNMSPDKRGEPDSMRIILFKYHINAVYRYKHLDDSFLQAIVEKTKERFPDTDFLLDPLNTYLIIDWSTSD